MQYDPRPDLIFLKEKVDNLETKLSKCTELLLQALEIIKEMNDEQSSKTNQRKCGS